MDGSKIEWLKGPDGRQGATWNPITGCSRVSAGCEHCYAERLAGTRMRNHPSRSGLTRDTLHGPVWTGEVRLNEQWLEQPLHWRRPRRIFVCGHSDLFHHSVPFAWVSALVSIMAQSPHHTFHILTKRPERMFDYAVMTAGEGGLPWSLPNVWWGTSVENQPAFDERYPYLRDMPAAVRWLSIEPMLGPVDVAPALRARALDQVVVGGESGPGARPMDPDWARSLRDQCQSAGVAFFFKQMAKRATIPDDLMIREYPAGR